ncbi:MAG: DeoR/GlpR family DNA-binding transcription regulator [Spirochaeta sp.]|nr:DeoR/GlpR family DNA-binding transcription regulator [Spirochaeta sp.]
MLAIERVRYIQSRIERDSAVKVDELARELRVSPITIRRDLKTLEERGKLTRTYGGAVSPDGMTLNYEERYDDKAIHNHSAKIAMARRCLDLIPDGASVILDAGTSTFQVARLLKRKRNITAATFDIRIASELYQAGIHTFVAGGEVQNSTGSMFGPAAEQVVSQMRLDIGVLGVAGISSDGVLYTPTVGKAGLKQQVMRSSSVRILLADAMKFEVSSFWEICSLGDFDYVVTDIELSESEWDARGVDPARVERVSADSIDGSNRD